MHVWLVRRHLQLQLQTARGRQHVYLWSESSGQSPKAAMCITFFVRNCIYLFGTKPRGYHWLSINCIISELFRAPGMVNPCWGGWGSLLWHSKAKGRAHSQGFWTFGTCWIFLDAFCTFDMFVVILVTCHNIVTVWHVMTCYDMLWHVMTCYDMLWHVMTCYDMLWHVMTCYDMLWHVMTCYDMLWHVMTCYDMLWHVMTCYDMLWHVMTCYDMLWHVMTCYDMLWHAMRCYDMLWHVMTCYDMLWHVMTCYDMLWHVMTCYDMLWHVMTCYDMLWHVMTCYDMLWHVMTCYDMLWHVMTSGRFQNIPEVRSLQMSSPNFPWTTQISDSEARALLEKMDAMFSWDLGISEICLDVWDQ